MVGRRLRSPMKNVKRVKRRDGGKEERGIEGGAGTGTHTQRDSSLPPIFMWCATVSLFGLK